MNDYFFMIYICLYLLYNKDDILFFNFLEGKMDKVVTNAKVITFKVTENVWTGKTKIYVNDVEATKLNRTMYKCALGDESYDITKRGNSLFGMSLDVNDEVLLLVRKLNPLEWVVSLLPIILVILGGAIGGFFGALAIILNIFVVRMTDSIIVKLIIPILITVATYFIVVEVVNWVLPLIQP